MTPVRGAAFVVLATLLGAGLAALAVSCTSSGGLPSAADVSAFAAQQIACVEDSDARAGADACRAASLAAFCKSWPVECSDGGAADGAAPDAGGQ